MSLHSSFELKKYINCLEYCKTVFVHFRTSDIGLAVANGWFSAEMLFP